MPLTRASFDRINATLLELLAARRNLKDQQRLGQDEEAQKTLSGLRTLGRNLSLAVTKAEFL